MQTISHSRILIILYLSFFYNIFEELESKQKGRKTLFADGPTIKRVFHLIERFVDYYYIIIIITSDQPIESSNK